MDKPMARVVAFPGKEESLPFQPKDESYGKGEAFCLGCRHTWVAVVPVGVTRLERPKCETMKGLPRFEYAPAKGEKEWTCGCGNYFFVLLEAGWLCPNCGLFQVFP